MHRFAIASISIAIAAACADQPAGPDDENPEHALASAVAGDAQISTVGTEVPAQLAARITSPQGRPLAGVSLTWSNENGGQFDPPVAVTDDSGYARTWWTLGPKSGIQTAVGTVGSRHLRFRATAADSLAFGAIRPMKLTTFDGSGEVVHPDIVRLPRGWSTGRRLLAITPYPNGDARKELPSVFASGDVAVWAAPNATANPIARPDKGYLSDPDVVFEPETRQIWLYYRQVTTQNTILLTTSNDGALWSKPITLLREANHRLISPSIVRVGPGDWHMWAVDAGIAGCTAEGTIVSHRTSADGIRWSVPDTTPLGPDAISPWHLDVTWVPDRHEFWVLYNAKQPVSCATAELYLATSPDGVHWTTRPTPVLTRGMFPQFHDIVYRSTLEYLPFIDLVTIWYSGASYEDTRWHWGAAVERLTREELFARTGALGAFRRPLAPSTAPILLDAP